MVDRSSAPVSLRHDEATQLHSDVGLAIPQWTAAGLSSYRCGERVARVNLDDMEAGRRSEPLGRVMGHPSALPPARAPARVQLGPSALPRNFSHTGLVG